MCNQSEFAKLRDRLYDLSKETAAQAEQIKTLFNATAELKATITGAFNRILWLFGIVLVLALLALVYGAVGKEGFNAVTKAAPTIAAEVAK